MSLFRTTRKDGTLHPLWRFTYRDRHGRRRKGTGTTSKVETQKLSQEVQARERMIRKGQLPDDGPCKVDRSFDEVRNEYLTWGKMCGGRGGRPWGPVHERMRQTHLAWWEDALTLRLVSDLDGCQPQVEQALSRIDRAPKTVANYAEAIHSFCEWCVDRDYLDVNPLRRLRRLNTEPLESRRAMTPEELQKILSVADKEAALTLKVALGTGLRANELRNLTVGQLDVVNLQLHLNPDTTKNRKRGSQPLSVGLVAELQEACKGKNLTDPLLVVNSHPSRVVDRLLEKVGIPKDIPGVGKLDFHACRTTFATMLFESGASLKEAQTLMRHSDPRLTMNTYAKVREGRLGEVADRIGQIVDGTERPKATQQKSDPENGSDVREDK